jgi:acetoin utilization deacetylase AcuC-like enzyme
MPPHQPDSREPDHAKGEPPRVLLVDDPVFEEHVPLAYHPERPERLLAARAALGGAGIAWQRMVLREATDAELCRVHAEEYLKELSDLKGQSGYLDPDTYVSPRSVAAARKAAGSLIDMVDAMLDGDCSKGVALLRPPGHHARATQAMGFCLLNNVAVAAAHARARGVSRVAIVDWDVHHGNGTQEMFWKDPGILYMSTHQFPFYPGTGAVEELGEGEGAGFTINVPLSAGGGDGVYRGAFERVLLPVLEAYAPELILVSAGFDAAKRDPLAEMELSAPAFGYMAEVLAAQAAKSAKSRIAMVLEGGYDLVAIEAGLEAAVKGMILGDAPAVARTPDAPDITRAASAARRYWKVAG